jgi:hypothetical protein
MSDERYDAIMNRRNIMKLFDSLCLIHSKVAYEEIHDEAERLKISVAFGHLVSYLTTQMNKISEEKDIDLQ